MRHSPRTLFNRCSARFLNNRRGFTLVELIIAVVIFAIMVFGITALIRYGLMTKVRSKEQVNAARMADMIYSQLLNANFYEIHNYDSATKNPPAPGTWNPNANGLGHAAHPANRLRPWAGSPMESILNEIEGKVRGRGFTRFSVSVGYKRRDSADTNNDYRVSDLIDFTDGDAPYGVDDFDPNVRFQDGNGAGLAADGDFWDTWYDASGKLRTEAPDTRLKMVTVRIWKGSRLLVTHGDLISPEKVSGALSASAENPLKLWVREPANGNYLFRYQTAAQKAAQDLSIERGDEYRYWLPLGSRPSDHSFDLNRADPASPLHLMGETEGSARLRFVFLDTGEEYTTPPTLNPARTEEGNSDAAGHFDVSLPNLTQQIFLHGEGWFPVYQKVMKAGQLSPWGIKWYFMDYTPPRLPQRWPAASATTKNPQAILGVFFDDTPDAIAQGKTNREYSGLWTNSMRVRINGTVTDYKTVQVPDTNTQKGRQRVYCVHNGAGGGLPPVLPHGNHQAVFEMGDRVGYKVKADWTFTVQPPIPNDGSGPEITFASMGGGVLRVDFRDADSGIRLSTVRVRVNGNEMAGPDNLMDLLVPDPSDPALVRLDINTGAGTHTVSAEACHFSPGGAHDTNPRVYTAAFNVGP